MSEEKFKNYRKVFGEIFNEGYYFYQQFIDLYNFRKLNRCMLKNHELIFISYMITAYKEAAIIRASMFFDPSNKASSLKGYLAAAKQAACHFQNASQDKVNELIESDYKLISSKSKIAGKVKKWRDKRICHQEEDESYLADRDRVYRDESVLIGELRCLLLMCKEIVQRYSKLYDGKTAAFVFEKSNLHASLSVMGKYNHLFDLPDNRLCGFVRTLSQYDASGWLKREIVIKQNDSGFPNVATSLRLFDKNGVEYLMKTTKGAHRKGYVVIGQAMRLRPWYKEHYDKQIINPLVDKVVLFPLTDNFVNDRRFHLFTEDEYRAYISRGQLIDMDLERNIWA